MKPPVAYCSVFTTPPLTMKIKHLVACACNKLKWSHKMDQKTYTVIKYPIVTSIYIYMYD